MSECSNAVYDEPQRNGEKAIISLPCFVSSKVGLGLGWAGLRCVGVSWASVSVSPWPGTRCSAALGGVCGTSGEG